MIDIEQIRAALEEVYAGPWGLKASDSDALNAVCETLSMSIRTEDFERLADEAYEKSNANGWDIPELAEFYWNAIGGIVSRRGSHE